ncbi:MAG: rod shape-determining protein MreD [Pseudomonadota bacterium]
MTLWEQIDGARFSRMMFMLILGVLALYIEMAPLGIGPGAHPSPDLVLCVVAYWAIRRPGSTPVLAVFVLGLMRDLISDVPVGAGALSLVLAAEVLKRWRRTLARSGFLREWIVVFGAALATTAFQWLLVMITLAQPPFLDQLLNQCLYTAMAYPVVAMLFRWVLRISSRKPEPA